MADLVKSVLGGARSLLVGWILPVFLGLQLVTALVLPALAEITAIDRFLDQPGASRQLALLAIAAVAGLVLAAAQAPLYRILEGYILWPKPVADRRIKTHQARRRRLVAAHEAAVKTDRGVYAGLLYERAARYPVKDKQFAPTMLGNAIRRFETYAGDRYQLDSQLLWHHLTAAAPERAVTAVDNARANADFFVCLLYGGAATALLGLGVTAAGRGTPGVGVGIAAGALLAVGCYRLAVLATDEWDAAVCGLVDHARNGVAAAFGLTIPASFEDERLMWRAVNTLVRRAYAYTESRNATAVLTRFQNPERPARRLPAVGQARRRATQPPAAGSGHPDRRVCRRPTTQYRTGAIRCPRSDRPTLRMSRGPRAPPRYPDEPRHQPGSGLDGCPAGDQTRADAGLGASPGFAVAPPDGWVSWHGP